MNPQIWTYIGYGLLALMFIGIVFISWGLYTSYKKNKNAVVSLPSLEEINSKQDPDKFFAAVESERISTSTMKDPNKAPLSRRELRQRGAEPTTTPKNDVVDTSSFFDEDDFKLSDGKD